MFILSYFHLPSTIRDSRKLLNIKTVTIKAGISNNDVIILQCGYRDGSIENQATAMRIKTGTINEKIICRFAFYDMFS